jgi:serine/threonine protein kinase
MQTARRQPFGDETAEATETRACLEPSFERLERLGSGEYGRVWRARDRTLDKEVALKVLRVPSASGRERAQLLNEARFLASLDHPNIVRIHSVLEERGDIELCLELIRGRTLEEIVRQDGPFSAQEAALIGKELCRALSAIHGQGLVHCDLKPANVMRTEDGRIVLFDFGLTRGSEGDAPRTIRGTPVFLAPEVPSHRRTGPPADLYALGVLLYYLVTGNHPIEASHLGEVWSRRPRVTASRCSTAGRNCPLVSRMPSNGSSQSLPGTDPPARATASRIWPGSSGRSHAADGGESDSGASQAWR